jgi:hypothetical protein
LIIAAASARVIAATSMAAMAMVRRVMDTADHALGQAQPSLRPLAARVDVDNGCERCGTGGLHLYLADSEARSDDHRQDRLARKRDATREHGSSGKIDLRAL